MPDPADRMITGSLFRVAIISYFAVIYEKMFNSDTALLISLKPNLERFLHFLRSSVEVVTTLTNSHTYLRTRSLSIPTGMPLCISNTL